MPSSSRDLLLLTLGGLALVLAARGAGVELLWLEQHHRSFPSPSVFASVGRFAAWLALGVAALQVPCRVRASRRVRALAAALVVAITAGVVGVRLSALLSAPRSVLTYAYAPDREVGRFPYQGGSEVAYVVAGQRTVAEIEPSGLRRCGASVPEGDRVIALVGDSFVWGKGVPDEGTLCAHLARTLAERRPGEVRVINAGQPGANIFSYVDTLRFAVETHGATAATVGLLLPDDATVVDVNRVRWLTRQPAFALVAAFTEPETAVDGVPLLLTDHTADLAVQAVLDAGIDRLAAEVARLGVPVVVYGYAGGTLGIDRYVERLREHARRVPNLHVLGALAPPRDVPAAIPGDFHPTSEGNAWYAERIAAALDEVLAASP